MQNQLTAAEVWRNWHCWWTHSIGRPCSAWKHGSC